MTTVPKNYRVEYEHPVIEGFSVSITPTHVTVTCPSNVSSVVARDKFHDAHDTLTCLAGISPGKLDLVEPRLFDVKLWCDGLTDENPAPTTLYELDVPSTMFTSIPGSRIHPGLRGYIIPIPPLEIFGDLD